MRRILLMLFLICVQQAAAQNLYISAGAAGAHSQVNPNFVGGGEYPFLNLLKASVSMSWNGMNPGPAEVDANGWPTYSTVNTAAVTIAGFGPTQFERPGNYALIWTGYGDITIAEQSGGGFTGGTVTEVSCTAVTDNSAGVAGCNNTGCTAGAGYISGTTLTVTTAPTGSGNCATVAVGQPIAAAGISRSKFGVPTIITASLGGGTYTVNNSQTLGSVGTPVSMVFGGRLTFSVSGEDPTQLLQWNISVKASGISGDQTDTVQDLSLVYIGSTFPGCSVNDEQTLWTGEVFSCLFRQTLTNAHIGVVRDLNWAHDASSDTGGLATTWATRKPITYWSWNAREMRSALYGGAPTLASNSVGFTGSISNGNGSCGASSTYTATNGTCLIVTAASNTIRPGQYLDGNTGVSTNSFILQQTSGTLGGAGTYIINGSQNVASEAMTLTSNDYSVSKDAGAPVDKEIWIVRWANTTTKTTTFSADGGTHVIPVCNNGGRYNLSGATPTTNFISSLMFDGQLNCWLIWGATGGNGSTDGLENGVPPEIFIQFCSEVGAQPWFTQYYTNADPITDYYTQLATYVQSNYPSMVPEFETPDELWNTAADPTIYALQKTIAYAQAPATLTTDSAWQTATNQQFADDWEGKAASILCQAISAVYSANRSKYICMSGVNTLSEWNELTIANPRLLSTAYLAQNVTNIPIQAGYTQTAAYLWANDISLHTYWVQGEAGTNNIGTMQEIADAYNFWLGTNTSSIMASYQASAFNPYLKDTIANLNTYVWPAWFTWATGCAGHGTPCGVVGMRGYEGGCCANLLTADQTQIVLGSDNGSSTCNLSTSVTFTGFIDDGTAGHNPGNVLSINSGAGAKVLQGAAITGTGITTNTVVMGYGGPLGNGNGSNGSVAYVNNSSHTTSGTLTANVSGAVAGMTVKITGATGGTWSTINGNTYTVQSGVTSATIPINLNCSGLGTLTSATVTYVGSENFVNFLRNKSYLDNSLNPNTVTQYDEFILAGGQAASQYTVGNSVPGSVSGWGIFFPDIYANFPVATSTSSSISGTSLTLGGTVTGLFQTGMVVEAKGATPPDVGSLTTITGCTLGISNPAPCGSTAGDILTLSQSLGTLGPETVNGVIQGGSPAWSGITSFNAGHAG